MTQIERIQHMERILCEAAATLQDESGARARLQALSPALRELIAYYESPTWIQDFNDDRAGKLPKELPRGVLSEDAVYNLLLELKEMHALPEDAASE